MNRVLITSIFIISCLVTTSAHSDERLGVGVVAGSTTGLSSNYYYDSSKSIDAGLELDLDRSDEVELFVTHLWHHPDSIKLQDIYLNWYYGAGVKLEHYDWDDYKFDDRDKPVERDYDYTQFGPRATIGLSYTFKAQPIDVFTQLSGTVFVVEDSDFDTDGVIGLRYYF